MDRQGPLSRLSEPMRRARPIYCGECVRNFPNEDWRVIASIEPPHLGGSERGNPRKRLTRDKDGKPDLSELSPSEHLLIDHRFSQWKPSIRQYVRDGKRADELKEGAWFATQYPLSEPSEMAEQNEAQMRFLHTKASTDRFAYYLLEPDGKKKVEVMCPYCRFSKRIRIEYAAKCLDEVLKTGGHLVLDSEGLEIRGGRQVSNNQNSS
jgi:hypothetical protein